MSIFVYLCIILKRKRKLVALLLLSYRCIVTISVLWVGLQCVIVVFPDQTHLLFYLHAQSVHTNIEALLCSTQNGICRLAKIFETEHLQFTYKI